MKVTTLAELGLEKRFFPAHFRPNFLAKDNIGNCWCIFEQRPSFKNGELVWRHGPRYDLTDSDETMPASFRGLTLDESFFVILGIQQHKAIPFIEAGTTLDYAYRHGYADDPNFFCVENDWVFRIDGRDGTNGFRTAGEALLAAEKSLFTEKTELVTDKIAHALVAGDTRLAMALAEHRGFWAGHADATRQMRELLAPALAKLKLAANIHDAA